MIDKTNAILETIDEDWFDEVIGDSIDMDWTSRVAARLIVQRLGELGVTITHTPRGTDCDNSPNGFHQVDTSMESGPNNCFYCEEPMT